MKKLPDREAAQAEAAKYERSCVVGNCLAVISALFASQMDGLGFLATLLGAANLWEHQRERCKALARRQGVCGSGIRKPSEFPMLDKARES